HPGPDGVGVPIAENVAFLAKGWPRGTTSTSARTASPSGSQGCTTTNACGPAVQVVGPGHAVNLMLSFSPNPPSSLPPHSFAGSQIGGELERRTESPRSTLAASSTSVAVSVRP